jgi:thiamine biosynthesis lipoprotein
MGCAAHVVLGDAPSGLGEWALAELERLEQCWSRFRDDSELARLHRARGEWMPVGNEMLLAFTCAADLHRATGGRFDPTIRRVLEDSGYDRTFEAVRATGESAFAPTTVEGFARVDVDADESRVRIPAGVRVDLGGIGKGLAADLIARGAIDRGARTILVNIGGDMHARGEAPPEGAWQIPVEDPFDESRVAFHYHLAQGAFVTSTTRIRAWSRDNVRYHHIIDPARGDAARTDVGAVVAAARDAWWAEGIAKSVIIAGSAAGAELARATGVRAWIYLNDGRVMNVSP